MNNRPRQRIKSLRYAYLKQAREVYKRTNSLAAIHILRLRFESAVQSINFERFFHRTLPGILKRLGIKQRKRG